MAASFQQAYVAARDNYGERWSDIKPAEQVVAIYREMRRIDAEHVAAARLRPRTRHAAMKAAA